MLPLSQRASQQIPLIDIIYADDEILLKCPDAEWFRVLYYFPWRLYQELGAMYYDSLHEFNLRELQKRQDKQEKSEAENESKEEAKQRFLFERPTMEEHQEKNLPVLFPRVTVETKPITVNPESISPGQVPIRLGGKNPKCFFALFKSFLGTTLMGWAPEPKNVHRLLSSNLNFARICGFSPQTETEGYSKEHIPSLRKLEQFDQIMSENGIWGKIKQEEVSRNIKSGLIKIEEELVGDTTHYHAYSSFETIHYIDKKGKEQKKSQSKVTKRCACEDKPQCEHPWELVDDGAGSIAKSGGKMYWGHKACVIGFPGQGIPLDARAMSDAASFDGKSFYPHVEEVLEMHPELKPKVKRVLYDSACDDADLKREFSETLGLELKTSMNPRRKKNVVEGLPRGIEKITPYGIAICEEGYEMDFQGIRYENEKFLYNAPKDSENLPVCLSCPQRESCSPNSLNGRSITISFDLLPHIDPNDPPMAKRFKAIMTRRPSVERMIKRLKCDLSDDRLSKRGNISFQAYLDKTMIAYHILLQN